MDELLELILELIDGLTGHKLDYGIGHLAGKLTRNIKHEKAKQVAYVLIWALVIILVCSVVLAIAFLIEAWKMGRI